MRNYCKFWYLDAIIKDHHPPFADSTFTNTFLARDPDDIYDSFGLYAQAFQGTHIYTLTNPEAIQECWVELSKDNVYKMFRLLATSFDDVVSMFNEPGQFSGTVPEAAFFDLFVFESPRDTWSHGE